MGWTQTSWMGRKVGVREEVGGQWDSLGHCDRVTGIGRRGGRGAFHRELHSPRRVYIRKAARGRKNTGTDKGE